MPLFFNLFPEDDPNDERTTFLHPSVARGFILDWDGSCDTKLDFAPIRAKYFKGERVPLVEARRHAGGEPAGRSGEGPLRTGNGGGKGAEPVQGAHELLEWLRMWKIPGQ
jgi:hypothetical protein